jgi:hypothetical protein
MATRETELEVPAPISVLYDRLCEICDSLDEKWQIKAKSSDTYSIELVWQFNRDGFFSATKPVPVTIKLQSMGANKTNMHTKAYMWTPDRSAAQQELERIIRPLQVSILEYIASIRAGNRAGIKTETHKHCTSCGNQIPDNSTFCLHCGKQIDITSGALQRQLIPRWEQKEFVYKWRSPSWVALTGPQSSVISDALLTLWEHHKGEVVDEIQKWRNEGWIPLVEPGPHGFRTRHSKKQFPIILLILWVLFTGGFGIFLIPFMGREVLEATEFRVQMRRLMKDSADTDVPPIDDLQSVRYPPKICPYCSALNKQEDRECDNCGRTLPF